MYVCTLYSTFRMYVKEETERRRIKPFRSLREILIFFSFFSRIRWTCSNYPLDSLHLYQA